MVSNCVIITIQNLYDDANGNRKTNLRIAYAKNQTTENCELE